MRGVRTALKAIGVGMSLGLALLLLAFGLAQSNPGKAWLARELSLVLSDPSERVTIEGLGGLVPFDLTLEKVIFADAQGPRLVITDAAIAIAPLDLLSRRLTLRLAAHEVSLERPAESGGGVDLARVLHPGIAIDLQALRIDRLRLGAAVLGEPATMRLVGSGRLSGGSAAAELDIERIDGKPGRAKLHMALAGDPPFLDVAADMSEPGGHALAGWLGRNEPVPLNIHLAGSGPLSNWHGRLDATGGDRGTVTADFDVTQVSGYRVAARGSAQLASLLPPSLSTIIGDDARFTAVVTIGGASTALDDLALSLRAGRLDAHGLLDQRAGTLAGEATLDLPDLSLLAPAFGMSGAGAVKAAITVGGTPDLPTAHIALAATDVNFDRNGAGRAEASIDVKPAGDLRLADTPIEIAGSGRVDDVLLQSAALPGHLGEHVAWRLAGRLDRAAGRFAFSELGLEDAGNTAAAHGEIASYGAAGEAHLSIPDLATLIGSTVHGNAELDVDFRADNQGAATAGLKGGIDRPSTGVAPLDAALGSNPSLAATLRRLADGTLVADDVSLAGTEMHLSADARRAPDGVVAGDFHIDLPRLAALDRDLAGRAALDGKISGPQDALAATAALSADGLAYGSARLDRLEATVALSDLVKPSGRVTAQFHAHGLDGTARAEASLVPGDALSVKQFHVTAAGTVLEGALTYRFADDITEGNLTATAPDLAPWSRLLGTPVAGRASAKAALAGSRGQKMELTAEGSDLRWGQANSSGIRKLRVTANFTDLYGKPAGRAELRLDGTSLGDTTVDRLRLTGATTQPGRFALVGEAGGKAIEPFSLAGEAGVAIERGAVDLRLAKLEGRYGGQPIRLKRALRLTRDKAAIAFADLALDLGGGEITGAGSQKGDALSLHLLARDLPVKLLAELGGQRDVTGSLGFELTVSGTRRHPQGELVLDGEQLRLAAAARPDLPALGLVASATWRGEQVEFKGRIAAPRNAALGFTGALPLTLDPRDGRPRVPGTGEVALHLEGDGELAQLADLLPSGEDRIAGRFTVDISVGGTVAAPAARGTLALRNGRYENFATGTNLTEMSFDLVGDRDHLLLQNFSARDGRTGTLAVAGRIDLAAATGPAFNLAGQLAHFRAVQLDQATATVSGSIRLTGDIAAPALAAELSVDSAELRVPERLPKTVQPISVIEINSATGQVLSAPNQNEQRSPWLAMTLDIALSMPGQVFVRGRGLDSEWRGNLKVTGTSAAPQIAGRLDVIRGSFAFIGKDFVLNSGTITFLGGRRIDPQISIEAQVSSIDVVAIVKLSGTATEPKIALSSQPALPQDEILSRVLFGSSISQISAAQGIEIAQAAAALAGGGDLGILDKIRTGLGLDRLTIGSAGTSATLPGLSPGLGVPALSTTPGQPTGFPGASPTVGTGTSPLPPAGIAGAGSAATAAAVSAGKYVAPGVYVGVTQGLTASTSSVDVQIDVTRHITINTTAGGTGEGSGIGTGVGVMWKLDY